jgi:hypothetical protein
MVQIPDVNTVASEGAEAARKVVIVEAVSMPEVVEPVDSSAALGWDRPLG